VVSDHRGQTALVVANLGGVAQGSRLSGSCRAAGDGRARRGLQAARGRARRSRPPALTGDRSHFSFVREAE
jgi:hypothetical protein